jgi:carboxylesterase type B
MGGSADERYNLTFIVRNSVSIDKPIIGVSIAYRLSGWGFLDSSTIRSAGVTNLGVRDQRQALWIKENIASFGRDPSKVIIWSESAGAASVGIHLTFNNGRNDHLFRAAISESGGPILFGPPKDRTASQAYYDNTTAILGCSTASDTLSCLRDTPFSKLNAAFNATYGRVGMFPYIGGSLIRGPPSEQLKTGQFIKVPYLLGANFDGGTVFTSRGIDTTADFTAELLRYGVTPAIAGDIEIVYPDIPSISIPATFKGRPPAKTPGLQFKRAAAFAGDAWFHASLRFVCRIWDKFDVPAYSYHFNVLVNGVPPLLGSTHFQEVAFVFDNTEGLGYYTQPDPFKDAPESFYKLAKFMSKAWVSFVHDLDPNNHGGRSRWQFLYKHHHIPQLFAVTLQSNPKSKLNP